MTRFIILTLISLIASISLAQTVTETQAYFAGGNQNALMGRIPKGEVDAIAKEWKNLMKKQKANVSGKEEIFAEKAVIKDIHSYPMNVYARIEQGRGDEIKITIAFDMGGYFMSSAQQPEQFKKAQKFLEKFVLEQSKNAYKNTLNAEKKELANLEKTKKKLEKANEKLAKRNEKLKQEMQTNMQTIKQNQTSIDNTIKKISDQEAKIKEIKNEKPKK